MKIPKQIAVGDVVYKINRQRTAKAQGALGQINYAEHTIYVATHDTRGNTLDAEEVADTFWHEITHAILHDMDHPLCSDERFVTKFASVLSTTINSAKL